MTIKIPLVAQSDLGSAFFMQDGKLMVAVGASTDVGNVAAATGSDGKVSVTAASIQTNQITYTLTVDSTNKLIKLNSSAGGSTTVSTNTIEAIIDEITVNGSICTFVDATTPANTITVDFSTFLTSLISANSTSNTISGNGNTTPFTVNLIVDPVSGNLLKIGANGVSVNSADILALLTASITNTLTSSVNMMTSTMNGVQASAPIINSNSLVNNSATTGVINSTVNGIIASANAIILTDLSGNTVLTGFA